MVNKILRVAQNLRDAAVNRNEKGLRYDNSPYWRRYYEAKKNRGDFGREKRYVNFLVKICGKAVKVVDLATGYGFLPMEFEKKGMHVVCVDKYQNMISLAKKYFRENQKEIEIIRADIVDLPLKCQTFDLVTAVSILEHFAFTELEDDVLPEIKRIMKNDGHLFVHVPVKSGFTKLKKKYRTLIKGDLPDWACDDDGDVTHKVWLSVEEYYKLIVRAGFKIEYISYNFARSNEPFIVIRLIDKVLLTILGNFFKVNVNGMTKVEKIISKFATSVAFVCTKNRV
jgi:SAM-dependent methyltransferase